MDPRDPANSIIHGKTPVTWVTEICVKNQIVPTFEASDMKRTPQAEPLFEVRCSVRNFGGRNLVANYSARSKKEAKHRASISMLNAMGYTKAMLFQLAGPGKTKVSRDSFPSAEPAPASPSASASANPPTPPDENLDTSIIDVGISNSKVLLTEFCQNCSIQNAVYTRLHVEGPSHAPIFTIKAEINDPFFQKPVVVQQRRQGNRKTVEQYCAYELLELLKVDEDLAKRSAETISARTVAAIQAAPGPKLEAEDVHMIDQLAEHEKKANVFERQLCGFPNCSKLISHMCHSLEKRICGEKIDELKELVASNQHSPANSMEMLDSLIAEQIENGLDFGADYKIYNVGGPRCYLSFRYDDQSYVIIGDGRSELEAKQEAAMATVEYIVEMCS